MINGTENYHRQLRRSVKHRINTFQYEFALDHISMIALFMISIVAAKDFIEHDLRRHT